MTQYVKVENGVVVQKQPYPAEGFIVAPDDVVCGMTYDGDTFSVPEPEYPDASPYRLYKSMLVQRLDPEEAIILEATLEAEDAKLRMMYNAVEYFMSDDPLFAYMHWVIASALGGEDGPNEERADELLAP